MRLALRLVAALACMLAVPAAAAGDGAVARFMRGVYAPYARGDAPSPAGPRAGALFGRDLLGLIRRDQRAAGGELGRLDYDPICDCQDYDHLEVQRIRVDAVAATTARATITFRNGDAVRTLRYDLQREAGRWRIADIHRTRGESLRALLRGTPAGK